MDDKENNITPENPETPAPEKDEKETTSPVKSSRYSPDSKKAKRPVRYSNA